MVPEMGSRGGVEVRAVEGVTAIAVFGAGACVVG